VSNIFICHSSYEPRCLTRVSKIKDMNFTHSIVFGSGRWKTNAVYKGHHDDLVEALTLRTSREVASLILERGNKIKFLEKLHESLEDCDESSRIIVDISTFPRDRLLMLLRYLAQRFLPNNVTLHHCSPESYATENVNEGAWLAQGVKRVEAVPGFNGFQKSRAGCLVIIQLGHERERPQITATSLEPDRIAVLHQGDLQYKPTAAGTSKSNNIALLDTFGAKIVENTSIAYNDWAKAKDEICKIYLKYHDSYNIFISPNGTKIQLMGALAAALKYPEIQIRYAEPQVYNPDSSFGSGKVWECDLATILSS